MAQATVIDAELTELITDILYQATFQDLPGYLYLLVEHQRLPDAMIDFRLVKLN